MVFKTLIRTGFRPIPAPAVTPFPPGAEGMVRARGSDASGRRVGRFVIEGCLERSLRFRVDQQLRLPSEPEALVLDPSHPCRS